MKGLAPTEKRGWMKKTARGGTGIKEFHIFSVYTEY